MMKLRATPIGMGLGQASVGAKAKQAWYELLLSVGKLEAEQLDPSGRHLSSPSSIFAKLSSLPRLRFFVPSTEEPCPLIPPPLRANRQG